MKMKEFRPGGRTSLVPPFDLPMMLIPHLPPTDLKSAILKLLYLQVFKSKRPLRIGYYTYIDGVGRVSPSCERAVLMAKQRLESLGHQVRENPQRNFGPLDGKGGSYKN